MIQKTLQRQFGNGYHFFTTADIISLEAHILLFKNVTLWIYAY